MFLLIFTEYISGYVEVGRVRLDSNLHPSDLMGLVTLGKSQFKPQGD